ncbi:MAG: hypothetical protein MZV49_06605 [Rhodopseudomonas palustris]|nr:hypothetical protein [Rhodopseudomonas palustris]
MKRAIEAARRSHDLYRSEFRVMGVDRKVRWLVGAGRVLVDAETARRTLMRRGRRHHGPQGHVRRDPPATGAAGASVQGGDPERAVRLSGARAEPAPGRDPDERRSGPIPAAPDIAGPDRGQRDPGRHRRRRPAGVRRDSAPPRAPRSRRARARDAIRQ